MRIYKLELWIFTLESSSVAPCLLAAGTLNWFIPLQHTYLYLKVNKFFIVKLEQILITKLEQIKIKSYWSFILKLKQIFVFGGNYSRVVTYILYYNPRACPRKLVNFLSELMYFYWKICYFGHFLYTAPGQPERGVRLYQGGRAPLAPRWLRPWVYVFTAVSFTKEHCSIQCTLLCMHST